jgi:outer membrane lipoprotein-sorting protein
MKQVLYKNNMTLFKKLIMMLAISLSLFIACNGDSTVRPTDDISETTYRRDVDKDDKTVREEKIPETNTIDSVLERMRKAVKELTSYQAKIKHTFRQPLLDSQTVRKGSLYYKKDAAGSKLRINFDTLKQDEGIEQNQKEQVLFDGVWLIRINYQLKKVEYRQLAEPNAPLEPLDLTADYLPIVGFTDIEDLKSHFKIILADKNSGKSNKNIHLQLKTRGNSRYKDDYSSIELWLDRKLFLPARIVAVSNQDEIQEIEFYSQSINKKLSNSLFQVGFSKNIIKLENDPGKSGR